MISVVVVDGIFKLTTNCITLIVNFENGKAIFSEPNEHAESDYAFLELPPEIVECNLDPFSEFTQLVYREVQRIQPGELRTYDEVARSINRQNAARAVGTALSKNPFFYLIPCHRVIGKKNKLSYKWGSSLKREILANEGILI